MRLGLTSALLLLCGLSTIKGFVPSAQISSTARALVLPAKKSSAADEAVAIFTKRYPKKEPKKSSGWTSFGMPTTYTKKVDKGGMVGKTLFDIDERKQRDTFKEIVRVYGEAEALEMCKALPAVLAFDKKNFAPSLKEFGKIFGDDEAKEMVMRNPGLLAIKPGDAATSTDQTMQLSYAVAATRPAGPVLLYGTLGLLSVPTIEIVTGVPFRANLLASIMDVVSN